MIPSNDVVLRLSVASPCSASWTEMQGDERTRFCSHCAKNVYNLSRMSAEEAAALIREKEGRLCVRFYRRADGRVLTQDCPVGLQRVRRRLAAVGAMVSGLLTLFLCPVLLTRGPMRALLKWAGLPPGAFPRGGCVVLGAMEAPTAQVPLHPGPPPQVALGSLAPLPESVDADSPPRESRAADGR